MGCIFCRIVGESDGSDVAEEEVPKKTTYSWDSRPKIDPRDFTIENLNNEIVGRLPDSIAGQQFIIRDCKDTRIYLFDHINTISIDDCENCVIFVGPVKASVFVRDCKNCRIAVSCQQFRTRDCLRLDVFLACVSQPIIEASTHVRVAPLQINYPQLESQFVAAGLSPFNCEWSDVYDFTPVSGEKNFTIMASDVSLTEVLNLPTDGALQEFAATVQLEKDKSLIPLTLGQRRAAVDLSDEEESCLVVFFHVDKQRQGLQQLLCDLLKSHPDLVLVRSREMSVTAADGDRIFGATKFKENTLEGPLAGFELLGPQAVMKCQATLLPTFQNMNEPVFISDNASAAKAQLDKFYGLLNMQMMM